MQVKTTDQGTVTLELTFDPDTEDRLRDEIFHNTEERALMIFIVAATNLKTADTKIMKFKGCVARVHCMPLDVNFVKGTDYSIVVDVHKFCPHSGGFTCFLQLEANYRQAEHTFVSFFNTFAHHDGIQLSKGYGVNIFTRNSVNHGPLTPVLQFQRAIPQAVCFAPLSVSSNFLQEQKRTNPCHMKKQEWPETQQEQKQNTGAGQSFLQVLEQLESESGLSFIQEEKQETESGVSFVQEEELQNTDSGFSFVHEEKEQETKIKNPTFLQEFEQQEAEAESGHSLLQEGGQQETKCSLQEKQHQMEGPICLQEFEQKRSTDISFPQDTESVLGFREKQKPELPYGASVLVKIVELRKVAIELKFDSLTVERLRREMSGSTGENAVLKFTLTAKNIGTRHNRTMFFKRAIVPVYRMPFDLPLKLGHKYKFEVDVQRFSSEKGQFVSFLKRWIKHREVLTQSELSLLLQRAKVYNHRRSTENLEVQFAYRNKPLPYFKTIMQKRGGIMEVYNKDRNGDPGCPINEQINGLFFGVRIDPKTRTLPDDSYFGDKRIIMPIGKLVEGSVKLYFADFYCHKIVHHITLVITKPGTQTDQFCAKHLLELSIDKNPFFFRLPHTIYSHKFYCSREPRVEILYTEDIDLKQKFIRWKTVKTLGRGSSSLVGLPKRSDCDTCNLYPIHSQFDTKHLDASF